MESNIQVLKTREPYWQYIRGFCIICVILIHCKTGQSYENSSTFSWNFDYWLILRQLINIPVALFIFLSGYLANIQAPDARYIPYIKKRVLRLLIPFLTWSLFY